MVTGSYSTRDLDVELARRRACPPQLVRQFPEDYRWEHVTVADLRAELAATPADDPERTWREWELALAERQAEWFPDRLFDRVVFVGAW